MFSMRKLSFAYRNNLIITSKLSTYVEAESMKSDFALPVPTASRMLP